MIDLAYDTKRGPVHLIARWEEVRRGDENLTFDDNEVLEAATNILTTIMTPAEVDARFRISSANPFTTDQSVRRKVAEGRELAQLVRTLKQEAGDSFMSNEAIRRAWKRVGANLSVVRGALQAVKCLERTPEFVGDTRNERLDAWRADARNHIEATNTRFQLFKRAVEEFGEAFSSV
jgi:hypothetical protein